MANVADPGAPAVPVAPTGLTVAIAGGVATLNWSHSGGAGLIDFTIQRATNASFTLGVSSLTAAAGATTAQDTLAGAGPYYYRIRANGSAGSSIWTNGSPFPAVGALAMASVFADVTFPAATGTPITWTAVATGGRAPLQYQFWRYSFAAATWSIVQAYGLANTYTWTPGPTDAGDYEIAAWVRSAGSSAPYDDVMATAPFAITAGVPPPPVAIDALYADTGFPTASGRAITWTAVASGGVAPLQYQFWRYSFAAATWSMVQDYGLASTYTWTPGPTDAGDYEIAVWVRSAASSAPYDGVMATAPFTITAGVPQPPVMLNALYADTGFPAPAGQAITWTTIASGGAPPLQYEFWRYSFAAATWSVVQVYGSSNTYTWTPTPGEAGRYIVAVWVRSSGSSLPYDAVTSTVVFTITP